MSEATANQRHQVPAEIIATCFGQAMDKIVVVGPWWTEIKGGAAKVPR
jgi:hypothetical protein